jgi:hypothetical protein
MHGQPYIRTRAKAAATHADRVRIQPAVPHRLRVFLSVLFVAKFALVFVRNVVLGKDYDDMTAWCADAGAYCFSTNSVRIPAAQVR